MRVQPWILISQIGVRNVVILVSKIEGGTPADCEQLHSGTKLSREVEVGFPKQLMVEVQKASPGRKKWFAPPEVHEVHLYSNRAAANAIRVHSVTIPGTGIADQCGSYLENPANCEWVALVNEPFVTVLDLVIPRIHGV